MSPENANGRIRPGLAAVAALLLTLVLVGPRATLNERWREPDVGGDVAAYLAEAEATVPGLRPEARKQVVWIDAETRRRTPLALVYLHGFSADRHEVDPLPQRLAQELGANLFFTRLAGHGRDGAAMAEPTAEDWLDDVAEALAVGKAIGDRVVLLGTSTGATLAVWAASREEARDHLAAVVLMSPNFAPADPSAQLLLWPWGGLMARAVVGLERCFQPANEEQARHWTTCYPTRALLPMMALAERAWTLDPGLVTAPVLTLYSAEDQVVDPDRIVAAHGRFEGAPSRLVPVDASPYAAHHVLAGDILAPQTTDTVLAHVLEFLRALPPPSRVDEPASPR